MAVFVILLALSMLFRGLSALGIHFHADVRELADYNVAVISGDEQRVESELTYSSYGDIAVKKDVPVTFVINADEDYITGCNNKVVSSDFGFNHKLRAGENVITFTPTETGIYTYTCWMNMIKNTIYVYE